MFEPLPTAGSERQNWLIAATCGPVRHLKTDSIHMMEGGEGNIPERIFLDAKLIYVPSAG